MKRIYTKDVRPGTKAHVMGWVAKIRDLGNIKFFLLRDSEGMVQVTAKKGISPQNILDQIISLGREDVVSVYGEVIDTKQAPGGREIVPQKIIVQGKAQSPLPIDVGENSETNLDKRLDWRVLDLRSPKNQAIFKIQAALLQGMEDFLRKEGFIQVFTPCLMGSASESGAEVFPVFYFNKEVYLRQDPQLHRELLIAGGFDRIFDVGPSWRAEPSNTVRHLCEHRGIAPEFVLENDETEVMRMEEGVIIAALENVKKSCSDELALLEKKVEIPQKPFPEIRFPEVYDILKKLGKSIPFGEDYDRESEKLLADWVKKKYKTDFFFVNRFPYEVKPFYVMKAEEGWARSIDFIFKGVELSSGGQREHRYDQLIRQVKEKKISPSTIQWFTEPFKYGVPPLGGFCIGLERFTMKLLDIENIREAVLFARTPDRSLP